MKSFFNKIRLVLAIFVCKLSIKVCRLIGLGGTSLPGKIALKLYPGVLKIVAKQFRIITVTGTNGKTTTTGIIAKILDEAGIEYITNSSVANLLPGITATFITSVNWKGESKIANALVEIDEGVFGKITSHFEPDIIVVTNFFRDQIDRFGGVLEVLERVRSTVKKSSKACLILNADDSLCASLGKDVENRVIYYGLTDFADETDGVVGVCEADLTGEVANRISIANESVENWTDNASILDHDTLYCLYCDNKYEYSYYTYEHLGGYKCPNCSYERPKSHVTCFGIEEMTDKFSTVNIQIQEINVIAKINLPGLFNIYNALTAVAVGNVLGIPEKAVIQGLSSYKPSFGRMEQINIGGKFIKVILVKNPAGFNQIIDYLFMEDNNMQLALLINDKPGDDTDISWIRDVNFEKLLNIDDKIENVLIAGTRSAEMGERLEFAGINADKINIFDNYNELLDKGLSNTAEGQNIYILPTYTAMLDIRKILKKRYGLKEFWQ
jgi:UDP-N-acetylmuramyl tripeptide synthase